MIQANELRIGNHVDFLGEIHQITGIEEDTSFGGYFIRSATTLTEIETIKPVPLSDELLKKLGFKQVVETRTDRPYIQYTVYGFAIVFEWDDESYYYATWDYFTDREEKEWHKRVSITSLHQLQNLYFALTQTELTINL